MERRGRHIRVGAVTALTLAIAVPAQGEWRSFGDAGGYEVGGEASSRDKAGGCIASFDFEGPGSTRLAIIRRADETADRTYMSVRNYEWSAKADEEYMIEYVLDSGTYTRSASGSVDGIYKGFFAGFPAEEFLTLYAASNSLHLYMNENVVDKLSLKGSAAGMALFRKCWAWVMTTERAAQTERDRFKTIPRDPFKTPPKPADPAPTLQKSGQRPADLPDGLEGG